jgi:hypothetical protein
MATPTPVPVAPEPAVAPLRFWDYARKAGVAAGGILGTALATGLLPDPWDKVAIGVMAVLTYFGVYQVSNALPGGQHMLAGSNPPDVTLGDHTSSTGSAVRRPGDDTGRYLG